MTMEFEIQCIKFTGVIMIQIYLPIGLLMIGNLLGVLSAYATGNSLPVPQFCGWNRTKYPLDGSICLSVEYSSHRVLG